MKITLLYAPFSPCFRACYWKRVGVGSWEVVMAVVRVMSRTFCNALPLTLKFHRLHRSSPKCFKEDNYLGCGAILYRTHAPQANAMCWKLTVTQSTIPGEGIVDGAAHCPARYIDICGLIECISSNPSAGSVGILHLCNCYQTSAQQAAVFVSAAAIANVSTDAAAAAAATAAHQVFPPHAEQLSSPLTSFGCWRVAQ